jgi:two-component system, NtrC family, nitrogen regulation response regulator GlnG
MPVHSDSTRIPVLDGSSGEAGPRVVPALTIVWHPDPRRAGELCVLNDLDGGQWLALARLAPVFGRPGESLARPLEDTHLSRSTPAFQIAAGPRGQVELRPGGGAVEVHGAALDRPTTITAAELGAGVILTVARRIVLCLHEVRYPVVRGPKLGLVGVGDGMEHVRQLIRRVANLDVPVLVRGETGTGKEMVARALVQAGSRADKPLVSVNMAAVSASTAVAELFGHERGAFTGATVARVGYFGQAAGGTLFLDEVGLTPRDLQTMLLRVLETGEVLPVGAARGYRTDARVVSATDSDLEREIGLRSFSEPLFHRLAGFQIVLPPLRQRREDIGELLLHFLERELTTVGARERLDPVPDGERPWLSASQVARLAMAAWPGNVRALRNAVRQLVIAGHAEPRAAIDQAIERLMERATPTTVDSASGSGPLPTLPPGPATLPPPSTPAAGTPVAPARGSREVTMDAFFDSYQRNGYSASATAAELGIPRTTVIALRDRHPELRNPNRIPPAELQNGLRECNGDLTLLAEKLKVSRRGLQLRLSQLSLDASTADGE